MDAHDLRSLQSRYGQTEVSLDRFARLVGTENAVWLRMRRQRDSTFPTALRSSSRSLYTLESLVDWYEAWRDRDETRGRPLAIDAEQARITRQEWALHEAVALATRSVDSLRSGPRRVPRTLVRSHDGLIGGPARAADAFCQLASAALLVAAGADLAEAVAEAAPSGWVPLTRCWEQLPPVAPLPEVDTTTLPAGFEPDPAPVRDTRVIGLLTRRKDETSTTRRLIAGALLEEVARTWALIGRWDRERFIELIEAEANRLLSRVDAARPVTAGEAADRLIALAGVEAGDVVLDPAMGEGETLLRAVELTRDVAGHQTIGVVGRELKEFIWLHAKLRFGLRGIAHDLGRYGDSLDRGAVRGTYRRIVAEPGALRRASVEWAQKITSWLEAGGVAAVVFDSEVVLPPYEPAGSDPVSGSAWRDVAAVVVIGPERAGERRSETVVVFRRSADGRRPASAAPVLLIQVQPHVRLAIGTGRETPEAALRRQMAIAVDLVHGRLEGVAPGEAGTEGVSWRGLTAFTREALEVAHPDDSPALREALRRNRTESAPSADRLPGFDPAAPAGPPSPQPAASGLDAEVLAEAREAARLLRWLIEADPDEQPGPETGKARQTPGLLASDTTDEMRRGLRRLQARLEELDGDSG